MDGKRQVNAQRPSEAEGREIGGAAGDVSLGELVKAGRSRDALIRLIGGLSEEEAGRLATGLLDALSKAQAWDDMQAMTRAEEGERAAGCAGEIH